MCALAVSNLLLPSLYVSRPKLLLLKDGSDVLWLDFDSRPDCAVAEQTFVVWLKIMDFVTQNDATDVGSVFPHGRNVFNGE